NSSRPPPSQHTFGSYIFFKMQGLRVILCVCLILVATIRSSEARPILEAIGEGIGSVFEGIGEGIGDAFEGIGEFFGSINRSSAPTTNPGFTSGAGIGLPAPPPPTFQQGLDNIVGVRLD
ncbi:unnamed protein product, partial [Meganyctiphanes norvegica]